MFVHPRYWFPETSSYVWDVPNSSIYPSWKCKFLFLPPFCFCRNLFHASVQPRLKPRLIALISLVWHQNYTHALSLGFLFCIRNAMYQTKMNLHGSKWDEPNWQWGFRVVAMVNCGVLSVGPKYHPAQKARQTKCQNNVFFLGGVFCYQICRETNLLMQCMLM